LEILQQHLILEERLRDEQAKTARALSWAGLFVEGFDMRTALEKRRILSQPKNIAGVNLNVFEKVEFTPAEYDLFITPLWVDIAIEESKKIISLRTEISMLRSGIEVLRKELRITTQRLNLFEKIKIPEAIETIRVIKIYLGDQMANAVGRSKIAKRKIVAQEALAA